MFDFDTVIDRKNTFSLKYDFNESRGYSPDTLPFWIADMDFKTAPCITETLAKAVSHGIFGYSDADDSYFEAVYHWFRQNFRWEVKQDWLVKTSGVVPALHAAVRAFTKPDDAVLIQPPVYQCFASAIETTGRRVVKSPLIRRGKKYSMNDFDDIERKIVENNVKLSLLCSPQNPRAACGPGRSSPSTARSAAATMCASSSMRSTATSPIRAIRTPPSAPSVRRTP